MQLVVSSNNVQSPLTLDLTGYINVQAGEGMDPYDPAFREAVISHSLLKEGGTLALEDLKAKELIYPLLLSSTSAGGLATLVQQINQAVGSPGATAAWRDDGMSQATTFELISGQLDIQYDYRRAQRFWLAAKLRLFTQPLGRVAGPRPYAAASGYGPLLMISPYASGGQSILAASTQAGISGFGGRQQPSGGVFYQGSPSLAGDAPALLQVSYVGPLPNGAVCQGQIPYVAVSVLPDALYQPLITTPEISTAELNWNAARQVGADAVASSYLSIAGPPSVARVTYSALYSFAPLRTASSGDEPTALWAGNHRLLAIARASGHGAGMLQTQPGPLVPFVTSATVYPGLDWALYDLGVVGLRASEFPQTAVQLGAGVTASTNDIGCALDLTALVMLPDNATWWLNPTAIRGSQYGYPPFQGNGPVPSAPYTNTLLIDDVLADQFIYAGQSQMFAPSPIGMAGSSSRITPFTRGLVPRPDPRNGPPIIAVLGVGQNVASPLVVPAFSGDPYTPIPAGSWTNQQTLGTMAQVDVLERTRYVFP